LADLFDAHVHTEFAYCAEDITVEGALERAAALGLGSLGLCEHADQLYLPREGFWERSDTNDRRSLRKAAEEGHSRVAAYRRRQRVRSRGLRRRRG
jgi:histidinol phosphatase-like PHP family hydrolase